MPPLNIEHGDRFGHLTYLRDAEKKALPSGQKPRRALVQCDCGRIKDVLMLHLIRGRIITCSECYIPSERKTEQIGKKYGSLTVIDELDDLISKGRRFRIVTAECDCGNIRDYRLTNLKIQQSCGCLMLSKAKERLSSHGMTQTRIYSIWSNMKNRCYNKKVDSYPIYGGAGIEVCSEWRNSFASFYEWSMANGYEECLTIDRYPNILGNYEPFNCRWATRQQQQNNKSSNRWVTYRGETMSLSDLCRKYNLVYTRVQARIKYLKWPIEDCVEKEWQDPILNLNISIREKN